MEQLEWILAEEELPKKEGEYEVKMSTGSMHRKVIETKSTFSFKGLDQRPHWTGAMDWNYVVCWKRK